MLWYTLTLTLTLLGYQRGWAVASPLFRRLTTEPDSTKPWFETWGWHILSVPSPLGMGYVLREVRGWLMLLPFPQSWQHLLCGWQGKGQQLELNSYKPTGPTAFHTNWEEGHRKNVVWRQNANMCNVHFQLLHRGFPKCCEAHFSAYSTLFPLSSCCSSWCQAATKDSKLYIFPLGKKVVTRCFPVPKQNQTNPFPESLSWKHVFLWLRLETISESNSI